MEARNQPREMPTSTPRGQFGRKAEHVIFPRFALLVVSLVVLLAVSAAPLPAQRLDARFEVGKPFPELTLPSLEDGSPTSIADFRGNKILLHVFASW